MEVQLLPIVVIVVGLWVPRADGQSQPTGMDARFEGVRRAIPSELPDDVRAALQEVFSLDREAGWGGFQAFEKCPESVRAVDFLLTVLSSGNVEYALACRRIRWTPGVAAYGALSRIKDAAQPRIAEAVSRGASDRVRASAAWLIGEFHRRGGDVSEGVDARVVAALLGGMEDPSPEVVARAAESAGRLQLREAERPLIGLLSHPAEPVRHRAVRALGELKSQTAVRPMLELLSEADEKMQTEIVWAVGELQVPWAAPSLLPLLDARGTGPGRADVHRVLGQLGNPIATPPLVERLRDLRREDRTRIARTLGMLGDARATMALVECLTGADQDVAVAAAHSLGEVGDRRAVPHLIRLIEGSDVRLRWVGAEALGKLGDVRAIEPLSAMLADDERRVVRAAAIALGLLNDARAIEPLVEALFSDKQRDQRSCEAIANALCEIRDPRVIRCLIENLPTEASRGRVYALRALNRLTGLTLSEASADSPQCWRDWLAQQEG